MKLEISHDTLANAVYEKASTEDRMRLRVALLIQTKYQFFKENGGYLSKDELRLVAPFERQLDLDQDVRNFIRQSQIRSRWRLLVTVAVIGVLLFAAFVYLAKTSYSLSSKNAIIQQQNTDLKKHEESLMKSLDTIKSQYLELKVRDSIHQVNQTKIRDRDNIISMTVEELQDALLEIQIKNEALEKAKAALQEKSDTLLKNNNRLTSQLESKRKQLLDHEKIKETLSTSQQSQELSQKAQEILHSRVSPTDAQYKEAFRLARTAWEMSNNNSQAMDLLNEIKNAKIPPGNSGFLGKNRPKYTYTHKSIRNMIREIDNKFNYGKLSPDEIKKRLK